MRSNDVYLGLPYNLVQFTSLQEIMAGWLGVDIGNYTHLSDSLHLYTEYNGEKLDIHPAYSKSIKNTDILSISRTDYDILIPQILDRMEKLSVKNDDETLLNIGNLKSKNDSYNNIMCILAVFAARRHNNVSAMRKLLKLCNNDCYKFLWNQWIKYWETKE